MFCRHMLIYVSLSRDRIFTRNVVLTTDASIGCRLYANWVTAAGVERVRRAARDTPPPPRLRLTGLVAAQRVYCLLPPRLLNPQLWGL